LRKHRSSVGTDMARNEPVAGQYRHNVIDRNGKTARCKVVVDQRQAADRNA
jgi:hypothetical protein